MAAPAARPVTSSDELLSAYSTTVAGSKLAQLLGRQAGFHRNLNVHPDAKAGSRNGNGTRSATAAKLTMAGMSKTTAPRTAGEILGEQTDAKLRKTTTYDLEGEPDWAVPQASTA